MNTTSHITNVTNVVQHVNNFKDLDKHLLNVLNKGAKVSRDHQA